MLRLIKGRAKKIGLPPGTLVHMGEKTTGKVRITIIDYTESTFEKKEVNTIEECFPFKDTPSITWINIDGVHQLDIIQKIGKHFDLHQLLLEDIVNTEQRPKMEDFDKHIFIVLKMLGYDDINHQISTEQLSLILGENFVISFQEKEGDIFNGVRERIRNGKGRIRKMGSDYLAYALIDSVVDHHFVVIEKIGDKIAEIEEELETDPTMETVKAIHHLKREMIFLRKSVWPLREVVNNLERGESKLIKKVTLRYIRDVYDHTIQIIDTIETFRDMLSGMLDLYLSSISNRMNEVMKVLTIIATIFIPLTFIAGVYGMNFVYMPELQLQMGYPVAIISMLTIAIIMLFYFKRKNWL